MWSKGSRVFSATVILFEFFYGQAFESRAKIGGAIGDTKHSYRCGKSLFQTATKVSSLLYLTIDEISDSRRLYRLLRVDNTEPLIPRAHTPVTIFAIS